MGNPNHPILSIYNGQVSGREVGSTQDILGSNKELDATTLSTDFVNLYATTPSGSQVKSSTFHLRGEGFDLALGIDFDQGTEKGFYHYWSTRYLIWANDAAKAVLGRGLTGEGPDISPCFLMNVLFQQLGWTGDAYMQAMDQCLAQLPVIHTHGAHITAGGALNAPLTPEQEELVRRFHCLGYYRAHTFAG